MGNAVIVQVAGLRRDTDGNWLAAQHGVRRMGRSRATTWLITALDLRDGTT